MSEKADIQSQDSFRDHIATINTDGKRNFIFPKKPSGKFYNLRSIASWFYLAIFFTLPFIKVNGNPLFMINVLERKFILFSMIFWPQDFFLFMLAMITFIVFIALFTVVYGRVFCGWACPQTIFLEMIFRKIEYWIDGDHLAQKKLKESAWTTEKIKKRTIKVVVFYLISFLIANFFLAYLISMDKLLSMISDPIHSIGSFIALLIFSGVFFFVFYWFREQVCIVVCPYGRLQGVLLDRNSILVAYDYLRGETRARFKRHEDRKEQGKGDCVDCHECVKVCPTGIDIRNGTQLECVNCTACIDACDHVMEQFNLQKGLIRYASEENIAKGTPLKFTPRIIGYTIVLTVLISILGILLLSRKPVDVTILRTPGMLYQKLEDNRVSNLYNIKLVNKTQKEIQIDLNLEHTKGEIQLVGKKLIVPKEGLAEGTFFIKLPKENIKKHKEKLKVGVYSNGKKIVTKETTFISPHSR